MKTIGEIEKQIEEIKESYEKVADAIPNAYNCLLRNEIVEQLDVITNKIAEAKDAWPKKSDYRRLTTPEDQMPSGNGEELFLFGKYQDAIKKWFKQYLGEV